MKVDSVRVSFKIWSKDRDNVSSVGCQISGREARRAGRRHVQDQAVGLSVPQFHCEVLKVGYKKRNIELTYTYIPYTLYVAWLWYRFSKLSSKVETLMTKYFIGHDDDGHFESMPLIYCYASSSFPSDWNRYNCQWYFAFVNRRERSKQRIVRDVDIFMLF